MMKNIDWYNSLNKPFLAPPSSVFPPVWTVLYIMIAISLILFLKSGMNKSKILPLVFFILQLIFNFAWSFLFFNMQNIGLALIDIIFMWIFTLLTVISFFKHSKIASILLIPYLIWISFAFYLNLAYFVLN